jgi:hypothetical protein
MRLLVEAGDRLRLEHFGLAELVWLPAGRPAAELNPGYGAPELFDGVVSDACDQYSLALIYQELLTGSHPFNGLNPQQRAEASRNGRFDLGPLPAAEREVVRKALSHNLRHRFPSCLAFAEALGGAARTTTLERSVAGTVPTTGQLPPPRRKTSGPSVNALSINRTLRELVRIASGNVEVRDLEGLRFVVRPGSTLEHRFVARLAPADIGRALADFRSRWQAALEEAGKNHFVCRIPLPASLLRRLFGRAPTLKVDVGVRPGPATPEPSTPLVIQFAPLYTDPSQTTVLLDQVGPEVLADLRGALAAAPEQRRQERWTFECAAQVWSLAEGTPAGTPLSARLRDVSLKGMRLHLSDPPETEELLIRLDSPAGGEPLDLVGRVANVVESPEGGFEVGIQFPGPVGPAGSPASAPRTA